MIMVKVILIGTVLIIKVDVKAPRGEAP